eukprot:1899145-Pleurochrysis_carterae.AAC.1
MTLKASRDCTLGARASDRVTRVRTRGRVSRARHVECEPDGADLLALEWPVRGVVVPRRRRA